MRKQAVILVLLVSWITLYGQSGIKNAYRIEGSSIVLYLDNSWSRQDQEKLLDESGMKILSLDSLWKFGSIGRLAKEGWKVTKLTNGYKVFKLLVNLSGNMKYKDVSLSNEALEQLKNQTISSFGFNSFKRRTVTTPSKGKTRFFLPQRLTAREVLLSGTFNAWSTLETSMIKTDSGWVADVFLQPGKHCYKFIVDGRWMADPENNKREDDFHGDYNSVYFVTNYEFHLRGYTNAKEVIVTGTFNNWNERELRMERTPTGWRLPVFLQDGVHAYKFIVDKTWINDPANAVIRDDGNGNKNSYICLGDTLYFQLNGYKNARQVIVSGDFNHWNERELSMKRTPTGWQLPHVLAPGNYQYKFIVDGKWVSDPQNPHIGTAGEHANSMLAVEPNYTFFLKGYSNAREVRVAGSFNDWQGYIMRKTSDGWAIDIYLIPGKTLYKFIVDGNWILDPGNKYWEQNEYGTGNSVLWFKRE